MGEIADMILDGILDEYTGEYLGKAVGYPRHRNNRYVNTVSKLTPSERKIKSIRKEIAKAIKSGIAVEEARRRANIKYGKGWRERGLIKNSPNQWSEEDLKSFL